MHTDNERSLQLWLRLQQGSSPAFEELYKLYAPVLLSYANKLTNDEELVQDSMQELFGRIWNSREKLGVPQNVRAYLLSSVRREIIRHLHHKLPETLDEEKTMPAEISVEEMLIQRQQEGSRSNQLIDAVKQLPARQQEAIFLRYFARTSFTEIAEIMDINIKGVYKLIYKAIDNLKGNPILQKLLTITILIVAAAFC